MEKFKPNLIFTTGKPLSAYTNASDGNAYPITLDMRDLVLEVEDQGTTSQCAAYTATSWIESIMWRRTGKPVHYNPGELYAHAKTIDGMQNQEGTTLQAILESVIDLGWMPGFQKSDIRYIYNSNQLKRAIHRYGTCLLGFIVTDAWYNHLGKLVMENWRGNEEGGHAVICTGYNNVGCFIQNSWGQQWGKYGFACIPWECFNRQFMQGAIIRNCLNGLED